MNNTEIRTGVISPIECVKEGWELIKSNYWILFAIFFVGVIIGSFTLYILLGAMTCGIFYCYLQAIDGRQVSFDGLWKGFDFFAPGLIVMLFIIIPMIVVYAIIYAPFIMAAVMGSKLSEDELMGLLIGAAAIDLVFILVMVCFHTLLMFSFPLIVDRKLGAITAMKTSGRAVWRNLGGVTGLILVNMGLVLLGYLALCIGVYFVIPVIIAGNVVAYRKIFPAPRNQNFDAPPPPNVYQGL
jgi:uncharacterized membrane protein